jgi:predicted nucleotidyltransferase
MTQADESPCATDHSAWRLDMAERLASQLDGARFGVTALYLVGSVKRATAGASSDIDLLVVFVGTAEQRRELLLWLEGWSLCLNELNALRTGRRIGRLLDVHVVTGDDIANRTSYAVKIGSAIDPARPLRLKAAAEPVRAAPEARPPAPPDRNG